MKISMCLVGLALAAGSAVAADQVDVQFLGTGAGRTFTYVANGNSVTSFAGQIRNQFTNGQGLAANLAGTYIAYCADTTEAVPSNLTTYQVTNNIGALPVPGPAMGPVRAQAIIDMYAGGNDLPFGFDSDYAGAFQLAIWEVSLDFNGTAASIDLANGNFSVTAGLDAGVISAFNTIVASIGLNASSDGFLGLFNRGAQDQIVKLVPIPGAGAMALAGLALVGTRRRR